MVQFTFEPTTKQTFQMKHNEDKINPWSLVKRTEKESAAHLHPTKMMFGENGIYQSLEKPDGFFISGM